MRSIFILIFITTVVLMTSSSCGDKNDTNPIFTDNFDRKEMLTHWADEIILPAYTNYVNQTEQLVSAKNLFKDNPDNNNFNNLKAAYLKAYESWQQVAMFDIGAAEQIGLRNFTNVYPTDTTAIQANIQSQNYNLELPSNFDTQGFPALDYLLYGTADDDSGILLQLSNPDQVQYLNDLINRIHSLSTQVLADWTSGYRDEFINNSGSSGTASVDKLVNDYLFYFERFLRAGKVGIPAGIFTGNTLSNTVEAPYSSIYSKEFFNIALASFIDFYNGTSYDSATTGPSLKDYLLYVQEQNNTEDIASSIEQQLAIAQNASEILSDSFKEQIENDHTKMLQVYDELQKVVILLKVDMMQALNIQIDYVDADGD